MKLKLQTLGRSDGFNKLLSSLISIVVGLLVGGIVVLIVGLVEPKITSGSVWDGIRLIFAGILSTGRDAAGSLTWGFNAQNIGNMLFRATPLIMTGLSVAVAFKTGLFNIGAPGQYLMGTLASLCIALGIPSSSVPAGVIWVLALLGGMLAGALWGAIPGLLKALLNINEVLACIMTNWIAANLVTWMFDISNFKNMVENTKSGYIYKTTYNGVATPKLGLDKLFPGSQINAGILLAILLAIVVYIIMQKTTFGYQLKACGSNRHAARYAGIPVALLAINNPIGVIFAGIFMAMLDIVGMQLTNLTAYNEYITDVIIAVIVYLSAFSLVIRMMLVNIRKRKELKKAAVTTAPVPPEAAAQPLDAPEETPPDAAEEPSMGADGEQEKGGEDA